MDAVLRDDFLRLAEAIGTDDFHRCAIPEHDMAVPGIVAIQIALEAGAFADLAKGQFAQAADFAHRRSIVADLQQQDLRSEEHTSELQSLMRISYAVFCLK